MPTSTRNILPNRVPCIVSPKDDKTPNMDNRRLLLPDDLTCSQLVHIIRKRIEIKPNQAIFVLCEDCIVSGTTNVKELLYKQERHNDGILYVNYALESVFG